MIKTLIGKVQRMPIGLRYVAGFVLLLACVLPLIVSPVGDSLVYGDREHFRELMRSGLGVILVGLGVFSALLLYGLIAAHSWARHGAVAFGWALAVVPLANAQGLSMDWVFGVFLFGLLPSCYFYCSEAVRTYFQVRHVHRSL